MSQDNQQSFMDSKTITAIVLVAAAWMGWQWYMSKKYPQAPTAQTSPVTQSPETSANNTNAAEKANAAPAATQNHGQETLSVDGQKPAEQTYAFEDDLWKFEFSSYGMGLKNIHLKKYSDRQNQPVAFGPPTGTESTFETNLIGRNQPLVFQVEKVGDHQYVGTAKVDGIEIKKSVEIDSERYVLNTTVAVKGTSNNFVGLSTSILDQVRTLSGGSFFAPSLETQEFFVVSPENSTRVKISHEAKTTENFDQANVIAFGTQYFAQALIDKSDVVPGVRASSDPESRVAKALVQHNQLNKSDQFQIQYRGFLGPKYFSLLKSIDENLAGVIDFGMFSWLARPILATMKGIHSILDNWGLAIILLTILVRLLVLPFNVFSYRSMKVMQKIQPQIQSLREKYKDNQPKLNEEMLSLMRTNKANPLGGCLPLLLQFPVFIALYAVLGHSIELYKAPFFLWIHDLSLKDPFYVLPVLMGVTMFIQQKITPNTMDPAQAKIMQFMPILFCLMMVSLPSGLTLYILISSLFALIQQYYFMRSNNDSVKV